MSASSFKLTCSAMLFLGLPLILFSNAVMASKNECINHSDISFTQESDTNYDLRFIKQQHRIGNRVYIKVSSINALDEYRIHEYFVPKDQAVNINAKPQESLCITRVLEGFGEPNRSANLVDFEVDENRRIFVKNNINSEFENDVNINKNQAIVVIARHDWNEGEIQYFGSMTVQLNDQSGYKKDCFYKKHHTKNNKFYADGVYAQGLLVSTSN